MRLSKLVLYVLFFVSFVSFTGNKHLSVKWRT